ncbi:hypothetical protein U8047_006456 [Pseudomonas aeruginosa]|uniref:antitoxin Xre-like helix-turn-helix domain-containing protein n=1 Tax=Pseudomonas aeruginosa TaxID=287 RepID=UPI0011EB434A|nr:antitoxin Xre-like helix-turn-helix domain-containing protein [Pseudomonas aeruginosa]EMB2825386.1 hypothetical protein [Pseudomonas aeruginosa]TYT31919.1 hypothetical protein FZC29_32675 [Pseudomonas aeruginosa]
MHATSKNRVLTFGDGSVVLRTALNILELWKATPQQACSILRVTHSRISRIRQGKGVKLDRDQLERASIVLNCHTSLRLIFENLENVYGFVSMENHNDFFNGRKPLEVMAQGDLLSLFETYKRIDALCGDNLSDPLSREAG